MTSLSLYLGRKVKVCLYEKYIMRGLFEQYDDKQYYIVLQDGSRSYFRSDNIKWIEML